MLLAAAPASTPFAICDWIVESVVATERAEGAGEEKVLSGLRGSVAVIMVPARDVPPYDGAVVGVRPSVSTSTEALSLEVDIKECLLSSSAEWMTKEGSGKLLRTPSSTMEDCG